MACAEVRFLRKYTQDLVVLLKAISSGNLVEEARIALFGSPSLLFAPWVVSLAAWCCRIHFFQSPRSFCFPLIRSACCSRFIVSPCCAHAVEEKSQSTFDLKNSLLGSLFVSWLPLFYFSCLSRKILVFKATPFNI